MFEARGSWRKGAAALLSLALAACEGSSSLPARAEPAAGQNASRGASVGGAAALGRAGAGASTGAAGGSEVAARSASSGGSAGSGGASLAAAAASDGGAHAGGAPGAPAATSGGAAARSGGASAAAAGASAAAAGAESFRHPAPGRVVAIGDVHGDLAATRAALRLAGAVDASDRWIGGDLRVVQTGDQLDRGDEEREILDLLRRLMAEARKAGGRLIVLNGNHEIMNVQGDFRYVTPAGARAFSGVEPRSPLAAQVRTPFVERAAAFLPGGGYAERLAERDVVAVVGDSVFVHGGLSPDHVSYGIERMNTEVRDWMRHGGGPAPEIVTSERAPVWMRDYGIEPVSAQTCAKLEQVLAALRVKRMIVGHTTQKGISSACDDRVYRIDVGLARYYGGNAIQVLEIDRGKVRVLTAPR